MCSLANDDQEVLRQDERHALSLVPKFLFFVVKEMAEVYVEQLRTQNTKVTRESISLQVRMMSIAVIIILGLHLSVIFYHDVAVVSVPYTQDEGGHAVACARAREQIDGLVVPDLNNEMSCFYPNIPDLLEVITPQIYPSEVTDC